MLITCKFPGDKLISAAEQTDLSVKPLCINAFFLLASYNKVGVFHCIYQGNTGYDFKIYSEKQLKDIKTRLTI